MMSNQLAPDRWLQVQGILDEILDLSEDERRRSLPELCGDDRELRLSVEKYLQFEDQAEDFLERPLLDLVAGRSEASREGEQLGSYCLQEPVADGGMGTVYRALRTDGVFDRRVAVKVLRRGFDTGAIVRGFRRERQILASLDHPSTVRLLDGGVTEDGLPYLVMEDVEGTRLDDFCDQRNLSLEQRLRLFEKLCDAVQAAHSKLIVHCDLKPSNILVTVDSDLKLLDFGIAKILEIEDKDATSTLQLGLGTPPYASPEQHQGEPVSTATDVYALGCLLYRLLALKSPPRADRRRPEDDPFKPSQAVDDEAVHGETPQRYRRRLRGDLDSIVQRAAALAPHLRYASAADLRDDVRRFLEHRPVRARPESPLYVMRRFARRHRLVVTLIASGLVSVLVGLLVLGWQLDATTQQRDRAVALQELYLETLEIIGGSRDESSSEEVQMTLERLELGLQGMTFKDQEEIFDRLGRILFRQGFTPESRDLHLRALALQRQNDPGDSLKLVARLNNLALVELELGNVDRSKDLLRQAFRLKFPSEPMLDAEFTVLINDLIIAREGDVSDAGLAVLISNLAIVLQDDDPKAAESLFRLALEEKKETHGAQSMEFATALNNLGQFLVRSGRAEEGLLFLEDGHSIQAALLGEKNERTLSNLSNLVLAWDSLGRGEDAIQGARTLLASRIELTGEHSIQTAKARNVLGFVLLRNGSAADKQDAERQLQQAIGDYQALPAPNNVHLMVFRRNLLATQIALGRIESAQQLIGSLLLQAMEFWPKDHWRLADLKSLQGALLLAEGDRAAALPLLLQGLDSLTAQLGDSSPYVVDARRRLEALGDS